MDMYRVITIIFTCFKTLASSFIILLTRLQCSPVVSVLLLFCCFFFFFCSSSSSIVCYSSDTRVSASTITLVTHVYKNSTYTNFHWVVIATKRKPRETLTVEIYLRQAVYLLLFTYWQPEWTRFFGIVMIARRSCKYISNNHDINSFRSSLHLYYYLQRGQQ